MGCHDAPVLETTPQTPDDADGGVPPPEPVSMRLAGFGAAALGALLAGIGSLMVWVTVGIDGFPNLDSPTRGVETIDGKVTLACAVVLVAGTMVSRVSKPLSRTAAAVAVVVAGIACIVIVAGFLLTAPSRFDPVSSDDLADRVAAEIGVSVDTARAQIEDTVQSLGGFRELGPGAFVTLGGGLIGSLGGLLTWSWARRTRAAPAGPPNDDDRADGPATHEPER